MKPPLERIAINAWCHTTWELLDPSPLDVLEKQHHRCDLVEGHNGPHQCVCGDSILILKP